MKDREAEAHMCVGRAIAHVRFRFSIFHPNSLIGIDSSGFIDADPVVGSKVTGFGRSGGRQQNAVVANKFRFEVVHVKFQSVQLPHLVPSDSPWDTVGYTARGRSMLPFGTMNAGPGDAPCACSNSRITDWAVYTWPELSRV